MERRVTQGTPSLSMTVRATVVLPLALPPARPITKTSACSPSVLYQGGRPGAREKMVNRVPWGKGKDG